MSTMNLELQLKLQDRMTAGMKAALKAMQNATKDTKREMEGLANAANKIKPTGIERMAKALREVKSLSKSVMDTLNKTAQAGAAIAAGGYVAKRALDKPMAYDRQLALTSNVAFSDRNVAGRIAGKMELDKAVRAAQKQGMGSQEDVLQTLNDLIGSGAMGNGSAGVNSSIGMLPTIAAASTGTGADPKDIAKIVMAAKQNMGMSDAEAKRFISQSITAGNLGGFEIKDMARYLPEQMASASANGMKGVKGAEDLLAFNQVARITAGNSDQAGNNVVNLLNKMNSVDTQRDFKKQGINLTGSLVANREKGVGTLDTFMGLVDNVASKNPEYKKLQAKAATQKGGDQKQTFEAMMDIMEQSGIGAVVQDRQAMAALLGARQNKTKMNEIRAAVQADNGGQVDKNMAVVDSTLSAKGERSKNALDGAAYTAEQAAAGPLGAMLETITAVTNANPVLAASAYAAATALGAIGAGSGVSTILQGGAGGAIGGAVGGTVAKVGAGALVASAGATAAAFAMPVAALSATAFLAYATATKLGAGKVLNGTQFGEDVGRSIAVVMAQFGNKEAQAALKNDPNQKPAEPYELHGRAGGQRVKEIKVIVEVKNGNITAAVNEKNTKQARRH